MSFNLLTPKGRSTAIKNRSTAVLRPLEVNLSNNRLLEEKWKSCFPSKVYAVKNKQVTVQNEQIKLLFLILCTCMQDIISL
jgi:hypothetical protein